MEITSEVLKVKFYKNEKLVFSIKLEQRGVGLQPWKSIGLSRNYTAELLCDVSVPTQLTVVNLSSVTMPLHLRQVTMLTRSFGLVRLKSLSGCLGSEMKLCVELSLCGIPGFH